MGSWGSVCVLCSSSGTFESSGSDHSWFFFKVSQRRSVVFLPFGLKLVAVVFLLWVRQNHPEPAADGELVHVELQSFAF